jgi:cytochrome c6
MFLLLAALVLLLNSSAAMKLSLNMKKSLHNKIAAVAVGLTIGLPATALAADLNQGQTLFTASCAGCHAGGINTFPFAGQKTLFKTALADNKMDSVDAIVDIMTTGRGGMMAYGEFTSQKGNVIPARFSPDEMKNIAAYVLSQADADWK